MKQAIVVENLSKRFRIGSMAHETMLRDVIVRALRGRLRPRKSSEEVWALRDVNFSVGRGELLGIVGRNGAGKTTLLKLLSGITFPTSGRMKIDGRVAALLEIGTGFHEELTGRENIALNGSILGMRRHEIRKKMDAIIEFSGVERFIDTPIKRYSSGMKVRLGFAVAAHLEPDLMLVDEVLAVGDAGFQRQCLRRMGEMPGGGRTVVFVSHNMAAIEKLCTRVIWIESGTVRRDGPTREVIREYLSSYSDAESAGRDLREAPGRTGNGDARFTAVELMQADGRPLNVFRSGEGLRVRLRYEVHEELNAPHFGIRIHSELGTLVTSFGTWGSGFDIEEIAAGPGAVELHVEHLNLMPGRYYLSLSLASAGPVYYDVLDHCATLDVETTDACGSGRPLDPRWGLVFVPARWSLVDDPNGKEM